MRHAAQKRIGKVTWSRAEKKVRIDIMISRKTGEHTGTVGRTSATKRLGRSFKGNEAGLRSTYIQ